MELSQFAGGTATNSEKFTGRRAQRLENLTTKHLNPKSTKPTVKKSMQSGSFQRHRGNRQLDFGAISGRDV